MTGFLLMSMAPLLSATDAVELPPDCMEQYEMGYKSLRRKMRGEAVMHIVSRLFYGSGCVENSHAGLALYVLIQEARRLMKLYSLLGLLLHYLLQILSEILVGRLQSSCLLKAALRLLCGILLH